MHLIEEGVMHRAAKLTALDFFAGSGLVTEGLKDYFDVVWANDNDPAKNLVYRANFVGCKLDTRSIEHVKGSDVPKADLAWGSFPCQDLSLAGNMNGFSEGTRSAVFWEWLRVLDDMPESNRPPVLAIENVVGFLISSGCSNFKSAYYALKKRGYMAGAFVIDAVHFVPQSRPRSFLIAVRRGVSYDGLDLSDSLAQLDPAYFPSSVIQASKAVDDPEWIWWNLPPVPTRQCSMLDVCQLELPVNPHSKTEYLLSMLSPRNKTKLNQALTSKKLVVGTGYKRVRREGDEKNQRFEVRFDGVAGCLRTPNGGSSRQILVIVDQGKVKTRLLSARETARLMGARDSFKLPGTYNEAYKAMGDAVAVPVTEWLAKHLLVPLVTRSIDHSVESSELCANG